MAGLSSAKPPFDEDGFAMHTRDIERLYLKIDELPQQAAPLVEDDILGPDLKAIKRLKGEGILVKNAPGDWELMSIQDLIAAALARDIQGKPEPDTVGPKGDTGPIGPQGPPPAIPPAPGNHPLQVIAVEACQGSVTKVLYTYGYIP